MAGETIDPRAEAQSRIIQRVEQDQAFRNVLLSDPKRALSEAFGVAIPDRVTIRVLEDTDDTVHLVLPRAATATGRMSDQELANVSGGHACPLDTWFQSVSDC